MCTPGRRSPRSAPTWGGSRRTRAPCSPPSWAKYVGITMVATAAPASPTTRSCSSGAARRSPPSGPVADQLYPVLVARSADRRCGQIPCQHLSGYDPSSAQPGEQVEKAVVGCLVVEETELAALAHVCDNLDWATEVSIRVPRRHQPLEVRLDQAVLRGDGRPDWRRVGQLSFQQRALTGKVRCLKPEPAGEARPHPAPAEDVTIHHIEGLVPRRFSCGGPFQMTSEQARIRHVCQTAPLDGRAGKQERTPSLATDRCVGRQRHSHVHGVAERVADDRMRAMHAPPESIPRGGSKNLILLRIIEILDVKSRLVLAKRRRRQRTFSISLEG